MSAKIAARWAASEYWERGKPRPLPKELTGAHVQALQFLVDGRHLSGDRNWRNASRLVWPGVAACLRSLCGPTDAIVISITSGGDRSAALSLYRHVSTRVPAFRFRDVFVDGIRSARFVAHVPAPFLDAVLRRGWDWHQVSGFILPKRLAKELPEPPRIGDRGWQRSLAMHLDNRGIYFEDHADACELRIWSKPRVSDARIKRCLSVVSRALRTPKM